MSDRYSASEPPIPRDSLHCRILLAEDGPEVSRFVAWILRRTGAHVDLAANGREAIEMFTVRAEAGEGYQLLLTDIEMPEMNGFELVRTLRERGQHCRSSRSLPATGWKTGRPSLRPAVMTV